MAEAGNHSKDIESEASKRYHLVRTITTRKGAGRDLLPALHRPRLPSLLARLRPPNRRERYNSRFKAAGQERLWVRNGSSAENLNTIAHITALAVAHEISAKGRLKPNTASPAAQRFPLCLFCLAQFFAL